MAMVIWIKWNMVDGLVLGHMLCQLNCGVGCHLNQIAK